ncbi:hypothetical protein EON80_32050 [bacterium]|nr:MAG: hypothetical protein EON80_32050 [bacterium]
MKRFAWLWGSLLGIILFPLLMIACNYGVPRLPIFPPVVTVGSFSLSLFLQALAYLTGHSAFLGGGLGCCGAMLWAGKRSLKWRLLSIGVGTGVMSYLLWRVWTFYGSLPSSGKGNSSYLFFYTTTWVPLMLAALLLIFFGLLMRCPTPDS